MLQSGEKLWNGAIVTPQLAACYNSLQERIASFRDAGKPVPDYLLNGAHNLIANVPVNEDDAIAALRRLNVPAMSRNAIYEMREAIAGLIISARRNYRECCDHAETRAQGNMQREYVESIADRLLSITRP